MTDIPSPFKEVHSLVFAEAAKVKNDLVNLDNWMLRYKQLFKLADQLPNLDKEFKQDIYLVEGCESNVWLLHYTESDHHYFVADSDSKILRGLLYLILLYCNGKRLETIEKLDFKSELEALDFGKYITTSRVNGLVGVVKKIQALSGSI